MRALCRFTPVAVLGVLVSFAWAQDEVRLGSPDGQIQFRMLIATPPQRDELVLPRLAYQVMYRGKLLMDTSFLGFEIHNQVPLLGENVGMVTPGNKPVTGQGYNGVLAEYVQNGSLGRLLSVEVRVYNDGVAFRYFIPPSTPMIDVLIEDEATEFRFAQAVKETGPLAFEQPGVGSIALGGSPSANYAAMSLARRDDRTLISRLARLPDDPRMAVKTKSPMATPWRVIAIGRIREEASAAKIVARLP